MVSYHWKTIVSIGRRTIKPLVTKNHWKTIASNGLGPKSIGKPLLPMVLEPKTIVKPLISVVTFHPSYRPDFNLWLGHHWWLTNIISKNQFRGICNICWFWISLAEWAQQAVWLTVPFINKINCSLHNQKCQFVYEDVCTIKSFVLQTVFYFQSDVKGVLSEVSL